VVKVFNMQHNRLQRITKKKHVHISDGAGKVCVPAPVLYVSSVTFVDECSVQQTLTHAPKDSDMVCVTVLFGVGSLHVVEVFATVLLDVEVIESVSVGDAVVV
jgi:hypothetical protein